MTQREINKQKLSKSILEMKFMKKSKLRAEKEKEVQEGEAMFSDAITEEMRHGESRFILEPSFIPCEQLIVGRLSFHGMNVDIERLMEAEDRPAEVKKEADVSDLEMAQQYSLTGAMARKFNTKREARLQIELDSGSELEPQLKKPKFLKPKD